MSGEGARVATGRKARTARMAGGHRIARVARSRIFALLAMLLLLGAARSSAVALAADGLPPGVGVPSWAVGQAVHFDPAEPHNPRLADDKEAAPGIWTPGAVTPGGVTPGIAPSADSLKYEGGVVENEPRLVLIFLGEGWDGQSALRRELEATAEGLPGSGFQAILSQYSSIDGPISPPPLSDSPIVEKYDVKGPSTGKVGPRALYEAVIEVERLMSAGGPNPNITYAVLPAPGTAEVEEDTCGYHMTLENEVSLAAIMDTEGREGCGPPTMTLTHEYAESVTDPAQSGWRRSDEGENEIADVCKYLGPQRMADGALVTALWDDSKEACEVEDDDPGSVPIGPYTERTYSETTLWGSTNDTLESETIEAGLYPCDLDAHYYFEYGTSKAYGSRTAEAVVPATWGEVKVSKVLAGLKVSTHYHWRVVVSTSNGTAYGGDHEFVIPYYVEVASEEAIEIETTRATLHAEVQAGGVPATYHFEYGPTEAYGSITPEESAGSGTSLEWVHAAITDLVPGTLYHFRIVASSSRGTVVGPDREFWTNGGAPVVATAPAKQVGYTQATLNGTVNPKGEATTYRFEYGATTAYGEQTAEQTAWGDGEERATIAGLTPDTTYHFRILATNSWGTSYGADQSFTTAQEPLVETEAPGAVGYDDATLGGAIDPQGTETIYFFEYGTSASYGDRTAELAAGAGTSDVQETQAIGGLAEDVTYHFRIVAIDRYGVTYGADQAFTTGARPSAQITPPYPVGPSEPQAPVAIEPPVTATVATTTPGDSTGGNGGVLAFSDLKLPTLQHGSRVSVALNVGAAGSRVEVDMTAPPAQLSAGVGGSRRAPVRLARLVRLHVAGGSLTLTVALDVAGERALRRDKQLRLTVKVVVTPPAGAPRVATGRVRLEQGASV
jgi:hypothetical protein